MLLETLKKGDRLRLVDRYFDTTGRALVEVFGKSERETKKALAELRRRFSEASTDEQNLLLHDDPVALAGETAEVPWPQIDAARLRTFNEERREEMLNSSDESRRSSQQA